SVNLGYGAPMLLLVVACVSEPTPPSLEELPPEGVEFGPEPTCADPSTGLSGLQQQDMPFTQGRPEHKTAGGSGIYLVDVDLDGDVDVLLGDDYFGPRLLVNDGTGSFTELEAAVPYPLSPHASGIGAVLADLNGDDLPELITASVGAILLYPNAGGRFSEPSYLWMSELPYAIPGSLSLGDLDGDGDLDLAMAGLEWISDRCQLDNSCPEDLPNPGSPVLLFQNNGDMSFTALEPLLVYDEPGYSVALSFTDREGDGDMDLLVLQDQGRNGRTEAPPSAFFRNDGGVLTNDAPEINTNLLISGMGIATWDLNMDGILDYCVTDTGPIHCLISDSTGWYDAGVALGLVPQEVGDAEFWSGWSIELEDLDNDGHPEVAVAGGKPTGDTQTVATYADAIFHGNEDGSFEDLSAEIGFGDTRDHFGMAAADFDGNGALDLLLGTSYGPPSRWDNPCTEGAWTDITLRGALENRSAIGARVEVEAGNVHLRRELSSTRAMGQSLGPLHFGLGDATRIDRLHIRWPDGTTSEWADLPVRRPLTVFHPLRDP
ncbi:MAG TPA: CRTAC1 family protein, partial [Myxococcota bacterium]|nr:CRTAC1 family protein [Myxococcota bacterium]